MPEDVATPPPTAVAPSGPAALNAVSDETLRHHVAAVLSQPLKEQLAIAPARIAPFMTNGMLVRVREAVVNITNTEAHAEQQNARDCDAADAAGELRAGGEGGESDSSEWEEIVYDGS